MNINDIIKEADLLVPNAVDVADKLIWLNAINQDFFNVVKIPVFDSFISVLDQGQYTLSANVRFKNIDYVMCGVVKYKELSPDAPNPLQNTFRFDDTTKVLTLSPPPYVAGLGGLVRYNRIGTATYTSSNITIEPDAPLEYHWTYIPALAAYIAHSMDDEVKAANYENQYKNAWNVAAQNYQRAVVS
ncbi:hypothetical protein [Paenibacillus ottowii]|uniref:Uncharacterized protein n=1 Tax=Paenibacillus ottowii TaxID=2315729 RepID=A0ABY3B383_9BACL|nr:hypothetical protein [Paenibacillus ottowii]TQR97308.1 hypothetical protein FKV70_18935 [Paenibacillus ottowii]